MIDKIWKVYETLKIVFVCVLIRMCFIVHAQASCLAKIITCTEKEKFSLSPNIMWTSELACFMFLC